MLSVICLVLVGSVLLQSTESQAVTITGPLVDKYCWYTLNGFALDTGANLKADIFKHTVHCMVEVDRCLNSGFMIVHQPNGTGTDYTVNVDLDSTGNSEAKELMLTVCPGDKCNDAKGFRVTAEGTVNNGVFSVTPGSMTSPDCCTGDSSAAAGPALFSLVTLCAGTLLSMVI
jgi:hypothetical protein